MSSRATLEIARCAACHSRFLPRPGACPRCGSAEVSPHAVPATGVVLAATELTAPARPFSAPHRLALVEVAEGARLLALVHGPLPAVGDTVPVGRTADRYTVTTAADAGASRGEGESHAAGRSRPPFEPPR